MIQSNTLIPTYQVAAGQYTTVKVGFVSDQMLSGKSIRFNPGFYLNLDAPKAKAFQLNYPPTAGTTNFNVLDCKNGTAKLIVKDAYNFDIEYSFFVTRNLNGWIPDVPHINSSALNVESQITGLGFYVKVGLDEAKAFVPIEILSVPAGVFPAPIFVVLTAEAVIELSAALYKRPGLVSNSVTVPV
jgi:hypothetical protein